ncbi:MAG TPA: hypothetical protein VMX74_15370, partial [Pirellulales bacterium]|nr:hypothetical protein [Pirellulales bacterium]
ACPRAACPRAACPRAACPRAGIPRAGCPPAAMLSQRNPRRSLFNVASLRGTLADENPSRAVAISWAFRLAAASEDFVPQHHFDNTLHHAS